MELRGMPPSHMLINYPHIFPPLGTLQLLTIKAYGRRQVYIDLTNQAPNLSQQYVSKVS